MTPDTAHWIWFGSDIPTEYMDQIENFSRLNPDIDSQMWDEKRVRDFGLANRYWFENAGKYVPADSRYQFMSDIARLEILHRHGGVVADLDFRWQKPLAPLLEDKPDTSLVTVWEQNQRHVANGFIAALPGHQALVEAIETVSCWAEAHRGKRANRITGPSGQWTAIVGRRRNVHILDQNTLIPVPWNHPEWCETRTYPNATAVHIWNHQLTLRSGK